MIDKKTYYCVQVKDIDGLWKFSEWRLTPFLKFAEKQETWQLQNEPNVKTRIMKLTMEKIGKKGSSVTRRKKN